MRIVDCHVHTEGETDSNDILKKMDENGLDRMLVCSENERTSLTTTREKLLTTKKLFDAAPDRISGLAWINPAIPDMANLAEEALCDMGFAGIKIIPDHWYVYEERIEPFWEKMHKLRASILFHTGILYLYEDNSRFCHPVYLEKLLWYPNIRFVMAHISWPWCEECLAVMGRMKAAAAASGTQWQSYIDTTPGTPPHIRKQAVSNALSCFGPERLMFGTDSGVPDRMLQKEGIETYLALYDELGLTQGQKERIMSGTADEVFPPPSL